MKQSTAKLRYVLLEHFTAIRRNNKANSYANPLRNSFVDRKNFILVKLKSPEKTYFAFIKHLVPYTQEEFLF